MDFQKFLQENKNAISKLAKRNSKYDAEGHALLTQEEIEEVCWDQLYKEEEINHE